MADQDLERERDREYEDFIRSYIRRTPEAAAKARIAEMFGADWKRATGRQKVGSVLSGLGTLLTGRSQYDAEREKALEEYKAVAPVLGREQAVLSAEERARRAAAIAQERNRIAEITAQSNAEYKKGMLGIAEAVKQGKIDLLEAQVQQTLSRVGLIEAQTEATGRPKNITEMAEFLTRKGKTDPKGTQNILSNFSLLSMIQGLGRALGQGQGGTSTSTGESVQSVIDPQGRVAIVKTPTTRTTTRQQPFGSPERIMEIMRGLGRPGAGQAGVEPGTAPGPAAGPSPAAPPAAPGARLQQMMTPGAGGAAPQPPAGQPGQALGGGARVYPLPEGYARTYTDWTSRKLASDLATNVAGIAQVMPKWYASGALDQAVGFPGGFTLGVQQYFGMTPEQANSLNWVLTKAVPQDINEASGKQFSQKEMDLAREIWPRVTQDPQSIMQRMLLVHFMMDGKRYMREKGLTQAQMNDIAGDWFDAMTRQSGAVVRQAAAAKGQMDWQKRMPSAASTNARYMIDAIIAKHRKSNPGSWRQGA